MTIRINKHHQKRKDDLIKSLQKASGQAAVAWMYLTANNDVPPEQIADVALVKEHLDIALEHLGVKDVPENE